MNGKKQTNDNNASSPPRRTVLNLKLLIDKKEINNGVQNEE